MSKENNHRKIEFHIANTTPNLMQKLAEVLKVGTVTEHKGLWEGVYEDSVSISIICRVGDVHGLIKAVKGAVKEESRGDSCFREDYILITVYDNIETCELWEVGD